MSNEYKVHLKFIENDTSLSSDYTKQEDEVHKISLNEAPGAINFSQIMSLLDAPTQKKMEGKIISYYHQSYKSYVFLGCILDNPRYTQPGIKPFDPDQVPMCVNALGPNKDINILNLLAPADNVMTFRIRERVRGEQIKALVQGEDPSTQKGSRRTKERKIGEVI